MDNRELKFRVCYTEQNGDRIIFYSNNARYLIALSGQIYENYGKSFQSPLWENCFDTYAAPYLEQFTGLKDKNGKEIYEGDIIQYTQQLFNTNSDNFPTKVKEVKWRASLGAWNVYETAAGESDVEVVGNVFENPELLKSKND